MTIHSSSFLQHTIIQAQHHAPSMQHLVCVPNNTIASTIQNTAVSVQSTYASIRPTAIHTSLSYSKIFHFAGALQDVTMPNVVHIASNALNMIALTTTGDVYGKGTNSFGELVTGNTSAVSSWSKIKHLSGVVQQVVLGGSHSIFLTSDGLVFTCGGNADGQLVRTVFCLRNRVLEIHQTRIIFNKFYHPNVQPKLQLERVETHHTCCVIWRTCM